MARRIEHGDTVILVLSKAEDRALNIVADEGASGLLTAGAESAAKGYIGGPSQIAAAKRALGALRVFGYTGDRA